MTSQPDKLFRDHLEHFQKPAPGAAWDRIESGLDRKPSRWIWFKIAAGILFLVVVSFLFWPEQETIGSEIQASANKPELNTHVPSPIVSETSRVEQTPMVTEVYKSGNKTKASTSNTVQAEQKTEESEVAATIGIDLKNELNVLPVPIENIHEIEIIKTEPITSTPQETSKPATKASSIILYTLSEMNSRFLKKDLPGEATFEKKNTSDIQKVLSLAYELKHDANIYGDLREKKNDLLTFNLFNDKKEPNK